MAQLDIPMQQQSKPDYGADAPQVLRNLFLGGTACMLLGLLLSPVVRVGGISIQSQSFFWPGGFMLAAAILFLLYVKIGKFHHRDFILSLHSWRGDEQVLDVGCGRGLLLAGAARCLESSRGTGHATGIDIWSSVDMGGNSAQATLRNLDLEGLSHRCEVVSVPVEEMTFPDATFDVIVSNICLHNIASRSNRDAALTQIIRVLKPTGVALISDFKHTAQYAAALRSAGFLVERRWGNPILTFPPLRVVVGRRPIT
jgi:arsenite methyltransferase